MCCLSLHAVSQSLLCAILPLLSHRCLCLTVSSYLICLTYLSCVLSHLTTVSLIETVSSISLGVFVLIFPPWWFAKGLVGKELDYNFFSFPLTGRSLFKSNNDGNFPFNREDKSGRVCWNKYSTVVDYYLCNTSQIWLNIDSQVK